MVDVLGRLELALLSQLRGKTEGVVTKALQNMMDRWLREKKDNSSSSGQSNGSPRESDAKTDTQLYRQFSLPDILLATSNFHNSFLVRNSEKVYKGCVNIDGKALVVAIKRFKTLKSLGDVIDPKKLLLHPNILSPIGFCTEYGLILLYDYMANGSLQDHLYHTKTPLSWEMRLKICIGVAQGLEYLRVNGECELIHRCIEPSSILLDGDWVAKIMLPNIRTTTNISAGILRSVTILYDSVDQEDDLYSFGVLLLEVLTCNKQLGIYRNPKYRDVPLLCSLKNVLRSENISQVMDTHLIGKIEPECLREFVKITLSCLFQQGIRRPSLDYVVSRLNDAAQLQEYWHGLMIRRTSDRISKAGRPRISKAPDYEPGYGWTEGPFGPVFISQKS